MHKSIQTIASNSHTVSAATCQGVRQPETRSMTPLRKRLYRFPCITMSTNESKSMLRTSSSEVELVSLYSLPRFRTDPRYCKNADSEAVVMLHMIVSCPKRSIKSSGFGHCYLRTRLPQ